MVSSHVEFIHEYHISVLGAEYTLHVVLSAPV